MLSDIDRQWMKVALQEAEKGWGLCSPNPMVGAVIAEGDRELSRGFHEKAGEAHAEIRALKALPEGTDLSNATLYVTLEPCTTTGRTPPCCDAVIRSGIKRVVIGCCDENPIHKGASVARLAAAGITVECGCLEEECHRLNEHFFWWIQHNRPWVILKLGLSLDGKIALPDGTSKWVTSDESRRRAQRLRQLCDLIMVGGATARRDNPQLTVREPAGWKRQPIPVVWTSRPLPSDLHLTMSGERPLVETQPSTPEAWDTFLSIWGAEEKSVLLIEGGGELAANALSCGIVNQIYFFLAPKIIGGRDSVPAVGGIAPESLSEAIHLSNPRLEFVGEDLLYIAYPDNCK